jgi:hypothetical protein
MSNGLPNVAMLENSDVGESEVREDSIVVETRDRGDPISADREHHHAVRDELAARVLEVVRDRRLVVRPSREDADAVEATIHGKCREELDDLGWAVAPEPARRCRERYVGSEERHQCRNVVGAPCADETFCEFAFDGAR